jgi:hypothetical protein
VRERKRDEREEARGDETSPLGPQWMETTVPVVVTSERRRTKAQRTCHRVAGLTLERALVQPKRQSLTTTSAMPQAVAARAKARVTSERMTRGERWQLLASQRLPERTSVCAEPEPQHDVQHRSW